MMSAGARRRHPTPPPPGYGTPPPPPRPHPSVRRVLSDGDIAGITLLYPRWPVRPVTRRDPSVPFRVLAWSEPDHSLGDGAMDSL